MSDNASLLNLPNVRLSYVRIQDVYNRMRATQNQRYMDWQQRNDRMDKNREYPLPKMRDLYPRVDINSDEREALHVTRRAIESLTAKSFGGSQGEVAEWTQVMKLVGEHSEDTSAVGHKSLVDCMRIMKENSYDISEGVRFIRTPLALRALEKKYYVTDLVQF